MKHEWKYPHTQKGFSLIEVIVYLALFSILIGGVVTCTYNLLESSSRDGTETQLVEEGNFLLDKIGWAVDGAQTINSPGTNMSGTTLSLTKYDASYGNPIVIQIFGNNMTIRKGTGTANSLNSTHVWLSHALFTHTLSPGQNQEESVQITFILNARTPTGSTVSQLFSDTYYIHI